MPGLSTWILAKAETCQRLNANANRLDQAKTLIQQALADIAASDAQYAPILDAVSTAASADPTNDAYKLATAEVRLLLQEKSDLAARAQTMLDAIDKL